MMKPLYITILVIVSAGLLFSGYLSAVKLLSGSCAFNESCPYFLGYPACWYGFAMFLAMFIVTLLAWLRGMTLRTAIKADIAVSLLGIIFSGSFVIQEIARSTATGALGLSTCVYGLVFYMAIFITSIILLGKFGKFGAPADEV